MQEQSDLLVLQGLEKISLIGKLISHFQQLGNKTAVLAVDPSSPLTGGAVLGDRVRMQGISDDENVFMRSLASRGFRRNLKITQKRH